MLSLVEADADVHVDNNQKETHPLENDNDDDGVPTSPRATKKRRTGSVSNSLPASTLPHGLPDLSPDNQIEEELASALTSGAAETGEHANNEHENENENENGNEQAEHSAEGSTGQESGTDIAADMATVISNIMNHSGRVEEQYALGRQQMEDSSGQTSTGLVYVKANSHLKVQSLPILDNLVSRIADVLLNIEFLKSHPYAVLVYPNPDSLGQIELPRHRCLHLRARFGKWRGLCDHAFFVRPHEEGVFYEKRVPLGFRPRPYRNTTGRHHPKGKFGIFCVEHFREPGNRVLRIK